MLFIKKLMPVILGFSFTVSSSSSTLMLESGRYECKEGNKPNFCPHIVKAIPFVVDNSLDGLEVIYSDECAEDGPYFYICDGLLCDNGEISFELITTKKYLWKNSNYDFYCYFEKVD